jgi:hypothetical protein
MLVHELRAGISQPTREVKLELGLISSDENRPMHSLNSSHITRRLKTRSASARKLLFRGSRRVGETDCVDRKDQVSG